MLGEQEIRVAAVRTIRIETLSDQMKNDRRVREGIEKNVNLIQVQAKRNDEGERL